MNDEIKKAVKESILELFPDLFSKKFHHIEQIVREQPNSIIEQIKEMRNEFDKKIKNIEKSILELNKDMKDIKSELKKDIDKTDKNTKANISNSDSLRSIESVVKKSEDILKNIRDLMSKK